MGNADPSVLLIDDDPEFRDSVARLLRTVGLHTREFSSVPDFLKADPPEGHLREGTSGAAKCADSSLRG